MTKFIEYILTLFGNFTPVKQIFLILIVGSITFLGYNFVKNENFRKSVIKLFVASFRSLKNKHLSILNHDLFYKQAFYNQLINNIRFLSQTKTKLFRILLDVKSTQVISVAKEWVKNLELSDLTEIELFDKMTQCLVLINTNIESGLKSKYKELLGDKGNEAFELIYESENGFKIHEADNINYIQRNIQRLAFTNAFSTKQKIWAFLNQLEISTEIAITDCEASFLALNGNIEKLLNKN